MHSQLRIVVSVTTLGFLTLGCSQINTSFLSQAPEVNQGEHNPSDALKWLFSADPRADANLAIQKQDYTLLAFASRATSFPGMNSDSSSLQQQCGYRLLPNSGDALRSESELILRKKLYQYAATYNQLIAAACQKNI